MITKMNCKLSVKVNGNHEICSVKKSESCEPLLAILAPMETLTATPRLTSHITHCNALCIIAFCLYVFIMNKM